MNDRLKQNFERILDEFDMAVEHLTDLAGNAIENPKQFNGFMGISIQHSFFSRKNMESYFKWASAYFKEFLIILMDDPDVYNFMAFKGTGFKESLLHARRISDEIKAGYSRKINTLGIDNIKVLSFRDFKDNPRYLEILSVINNATESDEIFKQNLLELMDKSIGGKIDDFVVEQEPGFDVLSFKESLLGYLIEELSSIIYFTECGYLIEVDPAVEFLTKRLLYEGEFPIVSQQLQLSRRGHVYVHPRGTTKQKILKEVDSKEIDAGP